MPMRHERRTRVASEGGESARELLYPLAWEIAAPAEERKQTLRVHSGRGCDEIPLAEDGPPHSVHRLDTKCPGGSRGDGLRENGRCVRQAQDTLMRPNRSIGGRDAFRLLRRFRAASPLV